MEPELLSLIIKALIFFVGLYVVYFTIKAVFLLIINLLKLIMAAAAIFGLILGYPIILEFIHNLQNVQP